MGLFDLKGTVLTKYEADVSDHEKGLQRLIDKQQGVGTAAKGAAEDTRKATVMATKTTGDWVDSLDSAIDKLDFFPSRLARLTGALGGYAQAVGLIATGVSELGSVIDDVVMSMSETVTVLDALGEGMGPVLERIERAQTSRREQIAERGRRRRERVAEAIRELEEERLQQAALLAIGQGDAAGLTDEEVGILAERLSDPGIAKLPLFSQERFTITNEIVDQIIQSPGRSTRAGAARGQPSIGTAPFLGAVGIDLAELQQQALFNRTLLDPTMAGGLNQALTLDPTFSQQAGAPEFLAQRGAFSGFSDAGARDVLEQRFAAQSSALAQQMEDKRLTDLFGVRPDLDVTRTAFEGTTDIITTAMDAWITGTESFAEAFKRATGERLRALSSEMLVQSLYEGAASIASLAILDFRGAGKHAAASAAWLAGSLAAGAAAREFGAGGVSGANAGMRSGGGIGVAGGIRGSANQITIIAGLGIEENPRRAAARIARLVDMADGDRPGTRTVVHG